MIDALKSILDFLGMVGNFVKSLVDGIMTMFAMIPKAFAMLTVSIGVLPSVLTAFALLAITLSIVYFVAGRNGS